MGKLRVGWLVGLLYYITYIKKKNYGSFYCWVDSDKNFVCGILMPLSPSTVLMHHKIKQISTAGAGSKAEQQHHPWQSYTQSCVATAKQHALEVHLVHLPHVLNRGFP